MLGWEGARLGGSWEGLGGVPGRAGRGALAAVAGTRECRVFIGE